MRFRWMLSALASTAIPFAISVGAQTGAPPTQHLTPEQVAKMPVTALPIEDFKLLGPNTGWVSTGNRVLLTTDNGAHWKDISPPNPKHDEYASIFFLDADTGWVLFSHLLQDDEHADSESTFGDWTFYLSTTLDGGATWNIESLPPWHGGWGLSDQGVVTFADKLHGWLSLGLAGSTVQSASALFLTSDGGRNWVPTKGGVGGEIRAMLALSDRDVWAVGSPEGESELDVSRDGGNSFQEIALAAPKEIAPAYLPTYHLPVFIGPLTGYEPVTYRGTSGSSSAVVLFATADGGRTWSRDRILTNLAAGENDDSTVAGSQWIVPLSPRGAAAAVIKLPSGATIPLPAHKVGALNRCRPGFVTPSEGWMNCSGELLATIDGGATWSGVTPHARNGILTTEPVSPRPSTPMQVKTTKLPRAAKTTDPLDIPAII